MGKLCSLLILILLLILLAACASPDKVVSPIVSKKTPSVVQPEVKKEIAATSKANNLAAYQKELAVHISQRNSHHIYVTQPQALLRSVIVIKFVLDAKGKLLSHDILRSNKDKETEQTALASLVRAQNFPAPIASWLRQGKLELIETWLFNSDGRFQLRTIALPQAGE